MSKYNHYPWLSWDLHTDNKFVWYNAGFHCSLSCSNLNCLAMRPLQNWVLIKRTLDYNLLYLLYLLDLFFHNCVECLRTFFWKQNCNKTTIVVGGRPWIIHDGRTIRQIDRWTNSWMARQTDGWPDGQMD